MNWGNNSDIIDLDISISNMLLDIDGVLYWISNMYDYLDEYGIQSGDILKINRLGTLRVDYVATSIHYGMHGHLAQEVTVVCEEVDPVGLPY